MNYKEFIKKTKTIQRNYNYFTLSPLSIPENKETIEPFRKINYWYHKTHEERAVQHKYDYPNIFWITALPEYEIFYIETANGRVEFDKYDEVYRAVIDFFNDSEDLLGDRYIYLDDSSEEKKLHRFLCVNRRTKYRYIRDTEYHREEYVPRERNEISEISALLTSNYPYMDELRKFEGIQNVYKYLEFYLNAAKFNKERLSVDKVEYTARYVDKRTGSREISYKETVAYSQHMLDMMYEYMSIRFYEDNGIVELSKNSGLTEIDEPDLEMNALLYNEYVTRRDNHDLPSGYYKPEEFIVSIEDIWKLRYEKNHK